jgi:hypothetical protein
LSFLRDEAIGEEYIVMKGAGGKNSWALFLMILAGIVLGGFIGMLAEGVPALSWIGYGQSFGLESPITMNLGILIISFGLSIKITIASILGVVLAIIIYRFL